MLSTDQIKAIIPHREPFLLIDEISEIDWGKSAVGIKHVNGDEYFFRGHFPGNPIMPGVLIIEAMAQVMAVTILGLDEYKGRMGLFAGIDNAKFKCVVRPGDKLTIKVTVSKIKFGIGFARGEAYVDGQLACEAEIKCAIQ